MPTFTTLIPIDLAINAKVGSITIVASEREDTIVTITPTHSGKENDRRAAENTAVTFDNNRLTITTPRPRFSLVGSSESVEVKVELPMDSRFTGEISLGDVNTVGRLGATRIKSAMGSVDIDITGNLWLRLSHGSTAIGTIEGDAELTVDNGQMRIGSITGDATLKASHGNIRLGEIGGTLEAKLSYGDLEINRALTSVTAKTAYGSITLDEVSSGNIDVESSLGQIRVGIEKGVAAWLDLVSKTGRVHNELEPGDSPADYEQSVSVRARAHVGEIRIRRAAQ
tara:strand:+ start:15484 stop:16332 length:849 start_codon:yes stop_codon:yes gene_type:complete